MADVGVFELPADPNLRPLAVEFTFAKASNMLLEFLLLADAFAASLTETSRFAIGIFFVPGRFGGGLLDILNG